MIPGGVTFGDTKSVKSFPRVEPHLAALLVGQAGKVVWTYFFPGYGKESIHGRLSRNHCLWPFSLGDLRIVFKSRGKGKADRKEYGPLRLVHLIVHARSQKPESLRPELIHPPWYESPWPGDESSEHASLGRQGWIEKQGVEAGEIARARRTSLRSWPEQHVARV